MKDQNQNKGPHQNKVEYDYKAIDAIPYFPALDRYYPKEMTCEEDIVAYNRRVSTPEDILG